MGQSLTERPVPSQGLIAASLVHPLGALTAIEADRLEVATAADAEVGVTDHVFPFPPQVSTSLSIDCGSHPPTLVGRQNTISMGSCRLAALTKMS